MTEDVTITAFSMLFRMQIFDSMASNPRLLFNELPSRKSQILPTLSCIWHPHKISTRSFV